MTKSQRPQDMVSSIFERIEMNYGPMKVKYDVLNSFGKLMGLVK